MNWLPVVVSILAYTTANPITYEDVQETPYKVGSSIHFIINLYNNGLVSVVFRSHNITLNGAGLEIYDNDANLLWDSNHYNDIRSDNIEIVPVVVGPLQWQTWSESSKIVNIPVITSPGPLEQLNLTNDETIYLWYRGNVTLQQASTNIIIIQGGT